MDAEKGTVTYTALAIVADQGIEQIQAIRQKHDPAYTRWPPHINIAFPFVPPQRFQEVNEVLVEVFKEFPQFQIQFKELDSLQKGVIFAKPTTTHQGNPLKYIYDSVTAKFPELVNPNHKEFMPHMTVANRLKKNQIAGLKEQLNEEWKEWKIVCKGLHMLERGKDTPFSTSVFIPFKE